MNNDRDEPSHAWFDDVDVCAHEEPTPTFATNYRPRSSRRAHKNIIPSSSIEQRHRLQ
jgi:hypothetical protein